MAEEAIRTIKVYERDAERLTQMFGGPQWRAFRLALAKSPCPHPEGMRRYVTAFIPDGNLPAGETKSLSGFSCQACGSYVFPVAGVALEPSFGSAQDKKVG